MHRVQIFNHAGLIFQPAENDPIIVRAEVDWNCIENTGGAMCGDSGDEQVEHESFFVAFELDKVAFGAVFEILREELFDELEQTENSNDFKVTQDFCGFKALDDGFFAGAGKQVKRETRNKVDNEPTLEVVDRNFAATDHQFPRRVLVDSVEIEQNIHEENHGSDVLGQLEKHVRYIHKCQLERQNKCHINQNQRNQRVPNFRNRIIGKKQTTIVLFQIRHKFIRISTDRPSSKFSQIPTYLAAFWVGPYSPI